MRLPLSVQNIADAKECPFYCKDANGYYGCVIKQLTSQKIWENIVPEVDETFHEDYNKNCEGMFDACCFVPLFWQVGEDQEEETPEDPPTENEDPEEIMEVKVSIHKVENPYLVKADVLVYPTNNLLVVDDPLLNRMTRQTIQEECDTYTAQTEIRMGDVYITSAGPAHSKGVQAKKIYHAVVAGESRLVNENDIMKAITKSLVMADAEGAEIVVMLPADCGSLELELAAFAQLSAINRFLTAGECEYIKYIFVVMDDGDSYEVFVDSFSRIFAS